MNISNSSNFDNLESLGSIPPQDEPKQIYSMANVGKLVPDMFLNTTLDSQEAIEQLSLVIEELDNGNVSVGIQEGDTVRIFAKNFTKQEAEILKQKIKQGEDELKNRSKQKWLEDAKALTTFSNDIGGAFGKVFTESTKSIVEGILAATFVSIFGIPGAIALSLTLSVAGAKSQENSVGPGILADVLVASFGANPAIALTLGAGVVISKLCRVEYKEDVSNG